MRGRLTFWATTAAVLALISIPSVDWLKALGSYARSASEWEPAPLKPTHPSFLPRDDVREEPLLKPVEFRHKASHAKSVELIGDFNGWRPGLLKLRRGQNGVWTLTAPVPPGRRKYLFLVDGKPELDPAAETARGPRGERVSVRSVK